MFNRILNKFNQIKLNNNNIEYKIANYNLYYIIISILFTILCILIYLIFSLKIYNQYNIFMICIHFAFMIFEILFYIYISSAIIYNKIINKYL